MYGEAGQRLVTSLLNSKRHEGDLVDATIKECWDLETQIEASSKDEDELSEYVLRVIQARNKRCILAYGWNRAEQIRAGATLENLTSAEERYKASLQTLLSGVGVELGLELEDHEPVLGSAFVRVRALGNQLDHDNETVVVEGEFARVVLPKASEALLRSADAERLSSSGHVDILF